MFGFHMFNTKMRPWLSGVRSDRMFSEHSQRDERRTRDGRAGVYRISIIFAMDGMDSFK